MYKRMNANLINALTVLAFLGGPAAGRCLMTR
jgi:hypothetical protein